MAEQIRFAIDLKVTEGSAEEVKKAIFEGREVIANFAKDVVVMTNDDLAGEPVKIEALAGGAHVHDTSDGYCNMCDRYSREQTLIAVPSKA